MPHPAVEAIEAYYSLINRKDWVRIAETFDLPAVLLIGPRKILFETPDAVVALYRSLGDKFANEGAVRLSWDRGSFAVLQVHDDLVVVKTVVTRETADRHPIRTWNCSHTARLIGAEWRFTLISSDDASNARVALPTRPT